MTYLEHCKVVVGGPIGSTVASAIEEWSCSLKFANPGLALPPMTQVQADDLADAILSVWETEVFSDTSMLIGNNAFLSYCKTYSIEGDGTSGNNPIGYAFKTTPVPGSINNNYKPYQVSCAISLDAGGRGRSRFGRFYLPSPAMTITADGYMSETAAETILPQAVTALQACVTAAQAVYDGGVRLIIASGVGAGDNKEVQQVRVGRVLDTQRRRRRSLPESYEVADL